MTNEKSPEKPQRLVSAVLDDGTLIETLYRPEERRTLFAVSKNGEWTEEDSVEIADFRYIPYSPHNNLLTNDVVLFPSGPEKYESEQRLIAEIQAFIHRYVQISPLFEKVVTHYVLFSWVHDAFNELPYIRARGDYGCGKTRFLLIVGALCYKPIFASGASTVSPLFRILDAFRGTLIIDESDFRFSDEKAELTKILNNGNARGFPVLRSELTPTKEFNPRAFHVYGPKLVATRGSFEDKALESRFLIEEMGLEALRHDLPINLPDRWKDEARVLRNKLLTFRLRKFSSFAGQVIEPDRTIEPRLSQIFTPLMSVVSDPILQEELLSLAKRYSTNIQEERGMRTEAQVLEIIRDLKASQEPLGVKTITDWFTDRHGDEQERKITAKWIGWIIRHRLQLSTHKERFGYCVSPDETDRLKLLYDRYGITSPTSSEANG